jgi:hypothetical protein
LPAANKVTTLDIQHARAGVPLAGSDVVDDQLERTDEGRALTIVSVSRVPAARHEIIAKPVLEAPY